MNQNSMPDEVLVKYLLGEATMLEKEGVVQWINESKENKEYFNSLKLIWKESARLAPVLDTPTEDAWARFQNLTANKAPVRETKPRVYAFSWLKAAAVLLLIAGSGLLARYFMNDTNDAVAAIEKVNTETNVKAVSTPAVPATTNPAPESETPRSAAIVAKYGPASAAKIHLPKKPLASKGNWQPLKVNDSWLHERSRTKEFVCNATPCPIEICIIQMIRCDQGQPSTVASCSTLEPDQAGQLHFRALDNLVSDCNATIEEIRIKRITTGETIVLNNNSQPATAQDLFNYLTGQKQGDILAGVFQADCNDRCNENSLRLGKDYGHLIFQ